MRHQRFQRLMVAGAAAALAGVGLAASLSYIHAQIDKHAGAYTSFCNVSDTVNCDRVLTSPFAALAGVPVAWLALSTYVLLLVAFVVAARSESTARRAALRLASLVIAASAAFSLYMAFVSLFVLGTICLMCTGLYAVAAVLVFIAVAAQRAYARLAGGGQALLPSGTLAATFLVTLTCVAAAAAVTWPSSAELPLSDRADLQSIRAVDPKFYDWYTALPVVDVTLLGLSAERATKPVTIVEFSDFECGFCRKNHELLSELRARRPDLVAVVYRHFPLDAACNDALEQSVHQRACRAAVAAECARAQGRFEEMADALFAHQKQLFDTMLIKQAAAIGLDMDAFERCLADQATLEKVVADARLGKRLKLTSTPTLFLNGRRVRGTFEDAAGYDRAVLIEARLAEGRSLGAAAQGE
jgi:protein-disulfide isomerase